MPVQRTPRLRELPSHSPAFALAIPNITVASPIGGSSRGFSGDPLNPQTTSPYIVPADNRPVTSGVYFCVLQAGKERHTRKLVLLK